MQVLCRMKLLVICMSLLVSNVEYASSVANDQDRLLQTLTQQAATISELQAKVSSQENQLSQQTAIISSLQASLAAQHSANILQDSGLQQLSQNVTQGTDRLAQLESTVQALTNQQASSLQTLQSRMSSLETRQASPQGPASAAAAFYADCGQPAFRNLTLYPNRPLLFNRVLSNVGNHYNIHAGSFIVPVPGLYSFTLHFMSSNHANVTEMGIYADDTLQAVGYVEGGLIDSNDQGAATAVMQLQKGQRVSVRHVYGHSVIWGSRLTNFSGMLVQAI